MVKPEGKIIGAVKHITADKREIKDFPKFPSATSYMLGTLYEINFITKSKKYEKISTT